VLGAVGLLVLPILLGPAALIVSIVAWALSSSHDGIGQRTAAAGVLLGGIDILMVMAGFALLR
jgi:hypothetical protein